MGAIKIQKISKTLVNYLGHDFELDIDSKKPELILSVCRDMIRSVKHYKDGIFDIYVQHEYLTHMLTRVASVKVTDEKLVEKVSSLIKTHGEENRKLINTILPLLEQCECV